MATKFHNPKSVALTGKYSLGVEVPADARLLFLAGQVGYDAKGRLAPGIEKQCELTWKNIGNILKSAGMGYDDIVRVTGFITDSRFIAPYRDARSKFLKSPYPAATLIVVSGLADPGMFVEIEVVAARR